MKNKSINSIKRIKMKKAILLCMVVFVATAVAHAQQISVVAPGGVTTLSADLNDAINDATDGSILYLSGGSFPIGDDTKITKKLTLIGIGHKSGNNNADGNTVIMGNLHFEKGADNSMLTGVYLSGDVNIGTGTDAVNTILVRYCNVNSIQVRNGNCRYIRINQNYIRNISSGGNSTIHFSNNILTTIRDVKGGTIEHNIIIASPYYTISYMYDIHLSNIKNNICMGGAYSVTESIISNNMAPSAFGDNCITVTDWTDVFVGPDNGINPTSNYALKGPEGKNAAIDGSDVGIYGGTTGFSDSTLPPGPRITAKKVAGQTDADGNLRVEIKVSAE
jgi:hypothetical protein